MAPRVCPFLAARAVPSMRPFRISGRASAGHMPQSGNIRCGALYPPPAALALAQGAALAFTTVAAKDCSIQEAYAKRVADGRLEESALQGRLMEFLSTALSQARIRAAAVESEGCRGEESWAWPSQTASTMGDVAEDHRRVAEYTSRLAADNARRVRSQQCQRQDGSSKASAGAAPTAAGLNAEKPSSAESTGSAAPAAEAGHAAKESRRSEKCGQAPVSASASQSRESRQQRRQRSVYMHGPVGTGKTMMLDLCHDSALEMGLRVLRRHFYEFMLDVHTSIHVAQRECPVEVVANTLADEVDMLCFDEFQITDIQDASILPRLFEVLFLRGVAVILTSNTAPPVLYSGGLNRHVHLPAFLELLGDNCTVLGLGTRSSQAVDYRRRAEAAELAESGTQPGASSSYFCGIDQAELLQARWLEECGGAEKTSYNLSLPMGRSLYVARSAGPVCRFSFEELCGTDRGEADYLALARRFEVLFLEDLPAFENLEQASILRRFVKLLDVLYDQKVRLAVSATTPLERLFHGIRAEMQGSDGMGELAWRTALYSADGTVGMSPSAVGTLCEAVRAAERAESRLREMRLRRYWERCAKERGTATSRAE